MVWGWWGGGEVGGWIGCAALGERVGEVCGEVCGKVWEEGLEGLEGEG